MEEERRLCYVGITRAKERLYLLRTFRRTMYGNSEPSEPSRFLKDIPRQLITNNQPTSSQQSIVDSRQKSYDDDRRSSYGNTWSRRSRVDDDDDDDKPVRKSSFNRPTPASPPPSSKQSVLEFHAGDKVHHATFGDGVVVSSKLSGVDEEIQIAFVGVGVKRLVVRYAGLKKK
jgi:DNA helicase-2/ATP-dependent DNA helicase PcrA